MLRSIGKAGYSWCGSLTQRDSDRCLCVCVFCVSVGQNALLLYGHTHIQLYTHACVCVCDLDRHSNGYRLKWTSRPMSALIDELAAAPNKSMMALLSSGDCLPNIPIDLT